LSAERIVPGPVPVLEPGGVAFGAGGAGFGAFGRGGFAFETVSPPFEIAFVIVVLQSVGLGRALEGRATRRLHPQLGDPSVERAGRADGLAGQRRERPQGSFWSMPMCIFTTGRDLGGRGLEGATSDLRSAAGGS
jgi:hypothetical protein